MDHYELLGLERDATAAHIRAAYLRLCTTTHPDRVRGRWPAGIGISDASAHEAPRGCAVGWMSDRAVAR
jgi:DnaJ-class molecular chaperone